MGGSKLLDLEKDLVLAKSLFIKNFPNVKITDDLEQELRIIMWDCNKKYNPTKFKISTLLNTMIRNRMLDRFKSSNTNQGRFDSSVMSFDYKLTEDFEVGETIGAEDDGMNEYIIKKITPEIINLFPVGNREVLKSCIEDGSIYDMSVGDLCREMNVTKSYFYKIRKQAYDKFVKLRAKDLI